MNAGCWSTALAEHTGYANGLDSTDASGKDGALHSTCIQTWTKTPYFDQGRPAGKGSRRDHRPSTVSVTSA